MHKELLRKKIVQLLFIPILLISIFNSSFILFFIPLILHITFNGVVKHKTNSLIFLVILIIMVAFLNQKILSGVHDENIIKSLKIYFLDIYNTAKYNVIEDDMGNIRTMQEPKIIDNFTNIDLSNFYIIKDSIYALKATLDYTEYYSGNASLLITYKTPSKDQILAVKISNISDWKNYNYINIWLKSDDAGGKFEFIITDADGDWWHYYNNDILFTNNWTLLKMPLKSFNNPSWTQRGNGKQNFENVTQYLIRIIPQKDEPGYHTLNLDEIYLSDI
jgi:hypothetical protein